MKVDGAGRVLPTISLDRDWFFQRRKARSAWLSGRGDAGERIDLPHCWNESETFVDGRNYYQGHGSYRRRVELPAEETLPEGRWMLESEVFYGLAEIWANGRRLATVDGQYLGFEIDVQASLKAGAENLLGLRLSNKCPSWVLPGYKKDEPDFILHGGLAGGLHLHRRPFLEIDRRRVRLTPRDLLGAEPRVNVDFHVSNRAGMTRAVMTEWRLFDDRG
ncbi:MAG: sugar-binding domain-containing protein, partial [Acidobacteriota bacterium]